MVDKDGLPYFNIFWTDPAEAAHDWPDFGDVMSRLTNDVDTITQAVNFGLVQVVSGSLALVGIINESDRATEKAILEAKVARMERVRRGGS